MRQHAIRHLRLYPISSLVRFFKYNFVCAFLISICGTCNAHLITGLVILTVFDEQHITKLIGRSAAA
jgi:hypothetical protein